MDSDFPQAAQKHCINQVAKGPSELVSGEGGEAHRPLGVHDIRCIHTLNRILVLHILENNKHLLSLEDCTHSPNRKVF